MSICSVPNDMGRYGFDLPMFNYSTAQTDNTTTTLQNITGLSQNLQPGVYAFEIFLPSTCDATGGIKYGFNYSNGLALTSIQSTATGYVAAATATQATTSTTNQATLFGQGAAVLSTVIVGSMIVSASGTLNVQCAQNAANNTSSVLLGASMIFTKLV